MKKIFGTMALVGLVLFCAAFRWNPAARVKAEAAIAAAASAVQPGDDWTGTVAGMSAADVTNGATLGAAAVQAGDDWTGTVAGMSVADVTNGATLGAAAVQAGDSLAAEDVAGNLSLATVTNIFGGAPSSGILSNLVWDAGVTTGNLEYVNGAIKAP